MKINLSSAKVAVGKKSKKSLRSSYLSSIGFYGMMPVFYWHQLAGDRIKGTHSLLSRANPLVLPSMIDSEFHINDFYVRWRDVWPAYNDYEAQTIYHFSDGESYIPREKPYVTMGELVSMFLTPSYGLVEAVNDSSLADVFIRDSANNEGMYVFTQKGYVVNKVLNNLGIRLTWQVNSSFRVNVMSLLAYMKIYFDWYYPPQYLNNLVVYNDCVRAFNNTSHDVHSPYLTAIRRFFDYSFGTFCFYDDDLWTMCWEYPNSPTYDNNDTYSYILDDGSGFQQNIASDGHNEATPYLNLSGVKGFTALGVRFLQKFSNMLKRNQLAGARFVDRFLLSRGMVLKDSHRAIRLGESRIPVRVGDVEANASGSNGSEKSVLGELAGKSISWNDKALKFDYDADSFDGIFISVLTLVANSCFGTGMDRHNLHAYRSDDYMPAFDNLGTAAVSKQELYQTMVPAFNNDPEGVFGFLPRYYEYCISHNVLSGVFDTRSMGAQELSGYHLFRDYDVTQILPTQSNNQMGFLFLEPTKAQQTEFNRIFYSQKVIDQFFVKFDTTFECFGYKKPLKDNYDFVGDEDHAEVSVESQGVHVN